MDAVSIARLRHGTIVATLAYSTCDDVDELILLTSPVIGDSFMAEPHRANSTPEEALFMPFPFEGINLGGRCFCR